MLYHMLDNVLSAGKRDKYNTDSAIKKLNIQ